MGKLVDLYFLTTYTEERLVGKLVNFRLLTPPATVASSPPIQKRGSWGSAHTVVSGPSPSFLSLPAIGAERDASAGRCGAVRGCPVTHPGGLGVLNARDTP